MTEYESILKSKVKKYIKGYTEYVIYIRKLADFLFFGAWIKHYRSRKSYYGTSWNFAKIKVCYMELEEFLDDLETFYCCNDIKFHEQIPEEIFFDLLEEFLELFNSTRDGSRDIFRVVEHVKAYFDMVSYC